MPKIPYRLFFVLRRRFCWAGLSRVLSRAAGAGGSGAVNLVSEAFGEGTVRFTLMAYHDSKGQGIPLLFQMLAFAMLFSGSAALCAGLGWAYLSEMPVGGWVAPVCVWARHPLHFC